VRSSRWRGAVGGEGGNTGEMVGSPEEVAERTLTQEYAGRRLKVCNSWFPI